MTSPNGRAFDLWDDDDAPAPTAVDEALLGHVLQAIAPATAPVAVECAWNPGIDGWTISVQPGNLRSCPFTLGYDRRDTVYVSLGRRTSFEYWLDEEAPTTDLAQLGNVLAALVAGHVEESGFSDGFARIWNDDAKPQQWWVGRFHFPWPWSARPFKRTYHAF